ASRGVRALRDVAKPVDAVRDGPRSANPRDNRGLRPNPSRMPMKQAFRYKAWANAEILDAIATIDAARFPEQWTLAVRLMNHTHVVDRIFAAHLVGAAHGFTATNTPETPGLEELRASIATTDDWYQAYVARLPHGELAKSIT